MCSSIIEKFICNAGYIAGDFHNIVFCLKILKKAFQAHHYIIIKKYISNVLLLNFVIKSDTICVYLTYIEMDRNIL